MVLGLRRKCVLVSVVAFVVLASSALGQPTPTPSPPAASANPSTASPALGDPPASKNDETQSKSSPFDPLLNVLLTSGVGALAAIAGVLFARLRAKADLATARIKAEAAAAREAAAKKAQQEAEVRVTEEQRRTAEASKAADEAKRKADQEAQRAEEERKRADEAARGEAEALRVLEERRRALKLPKQPVAETKRCSVLLLGIGGVGKSTLVQSLFGDREDVQPNIVEPEDSELPSAPELKGVGPEDGRTRRVRTWSERLPWKRSGISLSITDYVGQNLGTLVRFFAKAQKEEYSAVAYGWINAVVFVVDVRNPPPTDEPKATVQHTPEPDEERIKTNIDAWNWQAISAVWGMLTLPRFKKIVVVVRKTDLLTKFGPEDRQKIRDAYQPLFDEIAIVFPQLAPAYICGAKDGLDELAQLRAILWEVADNVSS